MLALVAVFASVARAACTASRCSRATAPGRRRLLALQMPARAGVDRRDSVSNARPRAQQARPIVPKSPKEMTRLQRAAGDAGFHGLTPVACLLVAEIALAASDSSASLR